MFSRCFMLCLVILAALSGCDGRGEEEQHAAAERAQEWTPTPAQEQAADKIGLPVELTLDCGKGVTMKLVLISAGTFLMGSPESERERTSDEGPQHRVTISKPFYMGVYEVTQEQYEAVKWKNQNAYKGAKNPVDCVSWHKAVAFCRTLSQRTGKTVRLPTEAEWEYACRAGTTTPFHFGETISKNQANYDKDIKTVPVLPVGSFQPNAWGLYDMHGNVLEWCRDWWADSYAKANAVDPAGPSSGYRRVGRGGSSDDGPGACRSAQRFHGNPNSGCSWLGFRVVVAIPAVD